MVWPVAARDGMTRAAFDKIAEGLADALAIVRAGPFRDPSLPPKPAPVPIIETWRCACGKNVLNHYGICYWCFSSRPKPKET